MTRAAVGTAESRPRAPLAEAKRGADRKTPTRSGLTTYATMGAEFGLRTLWMVRACERASAFTHIRVAAPPPTVPPCGLAPLAVATR
jgi:hypothetical protein